MKRHCTGTSTHLFALRGVVDGMVMCKQVSVCVYARDVGVMAHLMTTFTLTLCAASVDSVLALVNGPYIC